MGKGAGAGAARRAAETGGGDEGERKRGRGKDVCGAARIQAFRLIPPQAVTSGTRAQSEVLSDGLIVRNGVCAGLAWLRGSSGRASAIDLGKAADAGQRPAFRGKVGASEGIQIAQRPVLRLC